LIFLYSHKISFSREDGIFLKAASCIDVATYDFEYVFHNNQEREISLFTRETKEKSQCVLNSSSFVFLIKDVVIFECDFESNLIEYLFLEKGTEQLAQYWLAHTLLPIYFTLSNKYYFLHAGAVAVDEKAILFIADSYGGKSTMVDFFLKKGHPLISDDKVGTFQEEDSFIAVSSYPYHRPYRANEDLGNSAKNFKNDFSEVKVVYQLDVQEKHHNVSFKALKGIEKFESLIQATDIGLPLHLNERFSYIAKFANAIAVYRVSIPKDLERLTEVYEAIMVHQGELNANK
jgi:hypothetical protein